MDGEQPDVGSTAGTGTAPHSKKRLGPGKPFVKGDPRINRNGRPENFEKLRYFTRKLLAEVARDAKGDPLVVEGHLTTNLELILRSWIYNEKHQQHLLELAFGKVPDKMELTGKDGQPIAFADINDAAVQRLAQLLTEAQTLRGLASGEEPVTIDAEVRTAGS